MVISLLNLFFPDHRMSSFIKLANSVLYIDIDNPTTLSFVQPQPIACIYLFPIYVTSDRWFHPQHAPSAHGTRNSSIFFIGNPYVDYGTFYVCL